MSGGQLLSKYYSELVNGAGQSSAYFPLHVVGEDLVCVPQQRPVGPAQCEGHCREGEGTVSGDVVVHSLSSAGVRHADVVVHQQLRHDGLLGQGRSLGQGGVGGVEVRGRPRSDSVAGDGVVAPLRVKCGDDGAGTAARAQLKGRT